MKTILFFIGLFVTILPGYGQTAEEFYQKGNDKFKLQDYTGAIADYSSCIEINPTNINCYIKRGDAKDSLEKYAGAIVDYTKAIELDLKNSDYYFKRGNAKSGLRYFDEAIIDYTKAIEINPEKADYYYARGNAKSNLGVNVCVDFGKAAKLGHAEADKFVKRYCD